MIYRRNEKGRFEAVTDKGKVIPFENASEMIAFINMREEVNRLIGSCEFKEFKNLDIEDLFPTKKEERRESVSKRVKIRIYKGAYVTQGARLVKKKKTA